MKIVFLDSATLGNGDLSGIKALGELSVYSNSTPTEAIERSAGAEVLIVNKVNVTDELMAATPSLRLICEAATGVNNIDCEAASRRGIEVRNVAGYSTDSVAQITFAHILNMVCDMRRFNDSVIDRSYSRKKLFTNVDSLYHELAGKTMGVIGMGTIGQKVAHIACAFGMNVIYYSTSGTSHCKDYPSVTLDELLALSDVVSIHAPLNASTKGLIGIAQLSKMKKSAYIVNMGRGGIIVEEDLASAISQEKIAGAAVDVFETEPIPENHPYLHTSHPERLSLSPHVGWASKEAIGRLIDGIVNNIKEFYEL